MNKGCLKWTSCFIGAGMAFFLSFPLKSQDFEATQLVLNYEKLVQMKQVLNRMYEGYEVLSKGYNQVKNVAEGNFKLHEVFLNSLLLVNPEIRNYYRVGEIIKYQQYLLREYSGTMKKFRLSGGLKKEQHDFLEGIYKEAISRSLMNLEELFLVLTSGELRMSDFERLEAIDRLHAEMIGLLVPIRRLNNQVNGWLRQQQRVDRGFKSILELTGSNE
ncbi:TerB family tellurite resistance protein [Algoriphagus pacificus]|uniref:TerB family tellurite resistance protein n=1 Tax=Algoriphagus pacificus TaxID=2811234 RepID=A0ABS3CK39_9BACT|nr:TerB family tellurite resistance protein [Algoriphagus pacificus]MBN7817473.1 TerB family tellurite resistance protein [Algoriphagus pacificus]